MDALKSMGLQPIPDQIGFTRNDELRIEIPEYIVERSLDIIRIREHEWTHFRQHISTPLGLFYFRLHGIREFAIFSFFQELNKAGMPYPDMPFYIMHEEFKKYKDTHYKHLFWFLNLWHTTLLLEGVLLTKKIMFRDLIQVWSKLKILCRSDINIVDFTDKGIPDLLTKGSNEEMTCPDGNIRVIDLIEGYAKFQEIWCIMTKYSFDHAIKYLPSENSVYATADSYFRSHFDQVQMPFHPLSGALQEIALLCFNDPFMCSKDGEYYWEDNHPGYRFEEAVKDLSKSLKTIPETIEDIYHEALRAYGKESSFDDTTVYWLTDNLKDTTNIKDLKSDHLAHDVRGTLQKYYKVSFLNAFQLRMKYPLIYFEPRNYDMEAVQEYAAKTRPPFIISPVEICFSHGAGLDLAISTALAFTAFDSYSLNGIANDTNFDEAIRFARKTIYNTNVPLISHEEIRARLVASFGQIIESKLNDSLRYTV